MRILRKPLSILLSLVMILSVFTVIPVTTAGAQAVTATVGKWVKGELFNDSFVFDFGKLYDHFAFYRMTAEAAPAAVSDRENPDIVLCSSADLARPGDITVNDGYLYSLNHDAFAYNNKLEGS